MDSQQSSTASGTTPISEGPSASTLRQPAETVTAPLTSRPRTESGRSLVRTEIGRAYLKDEDGIHAGVPDPQTWALLAAAGVPVAENSNAEARQPSGDHRQGVTADARPEVGVALPSMAASTLFFVDLPGGGRRSLWTSGTEIFDVSAMGEQERTDALGPAVPVEDAYPGLADVFQSTNAATLSLTPNQQAILTYLRTIPPPEVTAAPGLSITPSGRQVTDPYTGPENVNYQVTSQAQTVQNVIDAFPVVAPVTDAIWPGAIIQSRTLASGQLGLVQITDRTPGTLTVTTEIVVQNHDAPTSVTVPVPSAATVTTARRDMLHNLGGTASTGVVNLEVGTITTEQQVSARLGAKVSGSSWNASADVKVSGSLETSRAFLKLTQEFYTVAFEPTGSPAWLFGPSVDVAAVQQYCGPNNAPAYVHQVTYGRVVLMVIDSADTASAVEVNVKAAWKAAVSGDVDAQTELKTKTKSYHVQIATVGTTGATTFRAAGGLKDAMDELTATANYSDANPGAVISYALRYLLDGTVAKAVVGPYSYTDLVRADRPQSVSRYRVDDGPSGVQGGVKTALTLRPGDQVSITAFGHVWAGWWFGSWFGPAGDTSEHGQRVGNGTKPMDGVAFSALLYGFGQGWFYWAEHPNFTYGIDTATINKAAVTIGSADATLPLWVHLNDNDVRNGKGGFSGEILVQRRELPAVGPK